MIVSQIHFTLSKEVNYFHNKSMDLAERALVARLNGDSYMSDTFFPLALDNELKAIESLEKEDSRFTLTNAILHRSAATLALDCKKPDLAKELVNKVLERDVHPEIAEELRDVLKKASCEID